MSKITTIKSNLLILLIVTLVFSCGKKGDSESHQGDFKISSQPSSSAEVIISLQKLTCEEKFCPQGIGKLLKINANSIDNCTAFLIAPDLVMTNSHCIFDRIQTKTEVCEDLSFIFLKDNTTIVGKCGEILWQDPKMESDFAENDFAIIKLKKKLPLEPVSLNFSELERGDKVTPYVMDHFGFDSRILKLNCEVSYSAGIGKHGLENCPGIKGNSGSPVFNLKGEVIGILSNGSSKASADEIITTRRLKDGVSEGFSISYIQETIGELLPYESLSKETRCNKHVARGMKWLSWYNGDNPQSLNKEEILLSANHFSKELTSLYPDATEVQKDDILLFIFKYKERPIEIPTKRIRSLNIDDPKLALQVLYGCNEMKK